MIGYMIFFYFLFIYLFIYLFIFFLGGGGGALTNIERTVTYRGDQLERFWYWGFPISAPWASIPKMKFSEEQCWRQIEALGNYLAVIL